MSKVTAINIIIKKKNQLIKHKRDMFLTLILMTFLCG